MFAYPSEGSAEFLVAAATSTVGRAPKVRAVDINAMITEALYHRWGTSLLVYPPEGFAHGLLRLAEWWSTDLCNAHTGLIV